MVEEKLISKEDAVNRIPADSFSHLLAPIFDRQSARRRKDRERSAGGAWRGVGSCGVQRGRSSRAAATGEKVVLARIETSPEDLRGMIAAEGILTARGGVSRTPRWCTANGQSLRLRRARNSRSITKANT